MSDWVGLAFVGTLFVLATLWRIRQARRTRAQLQAWLFDAEAERRAATNSRPVSAVRVLRPKDPDDKDHR